MAKLTEGDTAPDFNLVSVKGRNIALRDLVKTNQTTILVFLRHLGWLPCREHAAQLCQRQEELKELNTQVVIISFGTLPGLQAWMQETCNTFEVLIDPNREVYRAYQLDSSRLRSWTPRTVWVYLSLLLAGRKRLPKDGDATQLGGDFIVDDQGKLRLTYRSFDPADRPTVDNLITIIRRIQGQGKN